jgi:hypothetical protein
MIIQSCLISPSPEWQVQPQLGVEERVVTTEKTTEKSTEAIEDNKNIYYDNNDVQRSRSFEAKPR